MWPYTAPGATGSRAWRLQKPTLVLQVGGEPCTAAMAGSLAGAEERATFLDK